MSKVYLTEAQMRAMLAELKLVLNPPQYARVEKMHAELLELRERESIASHLRGTEPEYT